MIIDVNENSIQTLDKKLLKLLLLDHTTNKNIVWATDDYLSYDGSYAPDCEIKAEQITGLYYTIIKPRVLKEKEQQTFRTRDKAEVFTPSWICNKQNNLIDEQWFGRKNVFNVEDGNSWHHTHDKIEFSTEKGHTWQDYVKAKRLEITCGEAPYLVSRYDTVTGKAITNVNKRIGLLDRKLRVVNENTNDEEKWLKWVKKAYQSTYGYEFQGDNLLLARENLLYTFVDNMLYKFKRRPTISELRQIAYIVSWNIWQMDGLTYTAPFSKSENKQEFSQLTFFGYEEKTTENADNPIPCIIKDWTAKVNIEFRSML